MKKTVSLLDKDIQAAGLELRRAKSSSAALRTFGSINETVGDDGISAALLRELRVGLENLLAYVNHLLQLSNDLPGHTENVG